MKVAVSGKYAYVADHWGGIVVIDISTPDDPWTLATWRSEGCDCPGIAVAGRYAYAANYDSGLAVIDLLGQ